MEPSEPFAKNNKVDWAQSARPGWRQIIIDLVADLDVIAAEEGRDLPEIRSIGEKWGLLNVSLAAYSDAMIARIEAAEDDSRQTWQRCGGLAGRMRRHQGWLQNTCETCLSA